MAEQIVGAGLDDLVRARLERAHEADNGYFDVIFQVIGPKAQKQQYVDFLKTKPALSEQKEFYKFFGLTVPRGLTTGQAELSIATHTSKLEAEDKSRLLEWERHHSEAVEQWLPPSKGRMAAAICRF